MATIANLLVRISADASNVRSVLNRAQADVRNFAKLSAQQGQLATQGLFGTLVQANNLFGGSITRTAATISGLQRSFASTIVDLRSQLAQGLISREEFTRQGRAAGQAFNAGITAELKNLNGLKIPAGVAQRLRAGLVGQLKDVGDSPLGTLPQQLTAVGNAATSIGRTLTTTLTLPIVGLGIAGVKAAGDFEKSWNAARAFVEGTAADMEKLRTTTLSLGQVSAFSPTQIAGAIGSLGQAGLSAADIIKALPPIIKLATIENGNLDESIRLTTRTMKNYGLTFDQTSAFVDKMVAASLSGTVTVTELGNAFKYAGSISAASGQDFDVILALLTTLADKGLPASQGGAALRNMFARLYDPSKKSATVIKEIGDRLGGLGFHITNAQGNLLPFLTILNEFQKGGTKAGEAMKIFLQRAGPGLLSLLNTGVEPLITLTAKIKDAGGEADRVVNTQFSGLNAQLKQFVGSLISLAVAIGDSGILTFLTNMVNKLADFVRNLTKANPQILRTVVIFAGLTAIAGPLLSIMGSLITTIAGVATAIGALSAAGILGAVLGTFAAVSIPVIVGIAGAIALVVTQLKELSDAANKSKADTEAFSASLVGKSQSDLQNIKENLQRQLDVLKEDRRALQVAMNNQGGLPGFELQVKVKDNKDEIAAVEAKLQAVKDAVAKFGGAAGNAGTQTDALNKFLKQLHDQLNDFQGGPAISLDKRTDLQKTTDAAQQLIERLRLISDTSRGAADREAQLSKPLQAAQAMAAALDQKIAKIGADKAPTALLQITDELHKAISSALKPDETPFVELERQVTDFLARFEEVKQSTTDTVTQQRLLAPLLAEAKDLEDRVASAIAKQGGLITANIGLIRAQNQLRRQVRPEDFIAKIDPNFAASFTDLAFRYEQAKQTLQQAIDTKNADLKRSSEDLLDSLHGQILDSAKEFAQLVNVSAAPPEQKLLAWKKFTEILKSLGVTVTDDIFKTQRFLQTLQKIDAIVQSVGDLISALGVLGDGFGQVVQGASQLVRSIGEIKKAKDSLGNFDFAAAIPGIAGAIAGAVSIASGIFGSGGGESASDQLRRQEIDALEQLRRSLDRANFGIGQGFNVAAALPKLDLRAIESAGFTGFGDNPNFANAADVQRFNSQEIAEINKELASVGLSFADIQKAADSLGIKLFNVDGALDINQFALVSTELGVTADALRTFSDTIDNTRTLLDLNTKLTTGASVTPSEELANQVAQLQKVAPGLAAFIGTIDTTTKEGRDKLRAGLLALVAAIQSGAISADKFGQFASADDFLQFANGLADALNTVDDAATGAANAMLNVPTGFKNALRVFQAQDPAGTQHTVEIPGVTSVDITKGLSIDPGTLGNTFQVVSKTIAASQSTAADRIVAAITALGPLAGAAPAPDSAATGLLHSVLTSLDALQASTATFGASVAAVVTNPPQVTLQSVAQSLGALLNPEKLLPPGTPAPNTARSVLQQITNEFNFGDVVISGADKTAADQWKDIKRVARQEAQQRFGDPTKWGIVP
jgi:TP901 family phage tail tape measure protein